MTPTIQAEAEAIADPETWSANERMREVFLREVQARDLDAPCVAARSAALSHHHPGVDDCLVVAEAEAAKVARLLTFDRRLLRRLSCHAMIPLMIPSAYWAELNIPYGAPPEHSPAPGNPLAGQTWWRWEREDS